MNTLPTSAAERKAIPLVSGVLDYFPNALAGVAQCSVAGNEQHQPGEPLHWARGKSSDHADALARHLVDRDTVDKDGIPHVFKIAWRALALAEEYCEAQGAIPGRASKFSSDAVGPCSPWPQQYPDERHPIITAEPQFFVGDIVRVEKDAEFGWTGLMDGLLNRECRVSTVYSDRVLVEGWVFPPSKVHLVRRG